MSFRKRLSIKRKGPPTRKCTIGSFLSSFRKSKRTRTWKVLITGGAGHLAENLVNKLIEHVVEDIRQDVSADVQKAGMTDDPTLQTSKRAMKLRMLSKIEQGINERLPSCIAITLVDVVPPNPHMLNKYINYIRTSFDDPEGMRTSLEGVDTVFHLAAVGMTGHYARDRKACMDVNAVGTMNLLTWAKHAGVRRFIYTSSIGVIFTGKELVDAKESAPYPDRYCNYYCESKAQAERIVIKASTQEMRTTVLRFSGIYGPGEKRVTERVVNFMRSGLWVGVCRPSGKEAVCQLSSVANCVQGLVKAELTLRLEDSPHGQIYNIMDEEPVGTFSFWTPLRRALGFNGKMFQVPEHILRWLGQVNQSVADFLHIDPFVSMLELDLLLVSSTFKLKKARQQLGYEPYPNAMPEIIEMYTAKYNPKNPDPVEMDRQREFRKKLILVIFVTIVTIFTIVYGLYVASGLLCTHLLFPIFGPIFSLFWTHSLSAAFVLFCIASFAVYCVNRRLPTEEDDYY